MKRPNKTTLNPETFEHGKIASQTATLDIPFPPLDPEACAAVLHYIVERLDEPERSCVQMCAMRGISYAQAADMLQPDLGRLVDKKQTWRWTQRGLAEVRRVLETTSWIGVLLDSRGLFGTEHTVPPQDAGTPQDQQTEDEGYE